MLSSITDTITQAMLKAFHYPWLVTVLVSIIPLVESRGAILFAIDMKIPPVLAGVYSFLGSSIMAPILIAAFLPLVRWMMRTKGFKKIGETIYEKFEKKSQKVMKGSEEAAGTEVPPESAVPVEKTKRKKLSGDAKKMLGVFAFVAIPLPLTGVWTGSAVAAITRLPFHKALISVLSGNLVANAILTLLIALLAPYKITPNFSVLDLVLILIGAIAIITVLVLIIKIIVHKPAASEDESGSTAQ